MCDLQELNQQQQIQQGSAECEGGKCRKKSKEITNNVEVVDSKMKKKPGPPSIHIQKQCLKIVLMLITFITLISVIVFQASLYAAQKST